MKSRVNALLRRHKQVLKEASLASNTPEWVTFSPIPHAKPRQDLFGYSGTVLRAAVDWDNPVFLVGLSLTVNVYRVRAHAEHLVNAGLVDADKAEFEGRFGEAARLRGRARTGARILEAIEGQSSECQDALCRQFGGKVPYQEALVVLASHPEALARNQWFWSAPPWGSKHPPEGWWTHQACLGTGQNIRGQIRPPDLSAQIRCRIADSTRAPDTRELPMEIRTWRMRLAAHPTCLSWKGPTRVGPRDQGKWLREINQPFGWTPRKLVSGNPLEKLVLTLDQKISSRRVAEVGKLKNLPRHIRNSPQGYYLEVREEAYQIPRDDPWPEET